MNLRLVQFNLGPGQRAAAEIIATAVIPTIRQQPGCERAEFFGDEDSGDYGLIVLWATRKAADAAAMVIAPILGAQLAQANATNDSRRLFEIFEPKS